MDLYHLIQVIFHTLQGQLSHTRNLYKLAQASPLQQDLNFRLGLLD
jgi:hypothetical protein